MHVNKNVCLVNKRVAWLFQFVKHSPNIKDITKLYFTNFLSMANKNDKQICRDVKLSVRQTEAKILTSRWALVRAEYFSNSAVNVSVLEFIYRGSRITTDRHSAPEVKHCIARVVRSVGHESARSSVEAEKSKSYHKASPLWTS